MVIGKLWKIWIMVIVIAIASQVYGEVEVKKPAEEFVAQFSDGKEPRYSGGSIKVSGDGYKITGDGLVVSKEGRWQVDFDPAISTLNKGMIMIRFQPNWSSSPGCNTSPGFNPEVTPTDATDGLRYHHFFSLEATDGTIIRAWYDDHYNDACVRLFSKSLNQEVVFYIGKMDIDEGSEHILSVAWDFENKEGVILGAIFDGKAPITKTFNEIPNKECKVTKVTIASSFNGIIKEVTLKSTP